jgi:hypothetical protein
MKGWNGFCARLRSATPTGTSGSMPRTHARRPMSANVPASSGLACLTRIIAFLHIRFDNHPG